MVEPALGYEQSTYPPTFIQLREKPNDYAKENPRTRFLKKSASVLVSPDKQMFLNL